MAELYRDRRITCSDSEIVIKGYYFPRGSKHIAYTAIRAARRVELGTLSGRARIWGTSNPRYWANLDPRRARKKTGFVLEVDGPIRPFLTPDDPDAFVAVIRERAPQVTIEDGGGPRLI
jgi:hypothetical protein